MQDFGSAHHCDTTHARCSLRYYSLLPTVPFSATHEEHQHPLSTGEAPAGPPSLRGLGPPAAASPLTNAAVAMADVPSQLPGLP